MGREKEWKKVLIHLISQTHFNITIIKKYKKEQAKKAKLKRRGEEIKEIQEKKVYLGCLEYQGKVPETS